MLIRPNRILPMSILFISAQLNNIFIHLFKNKK